MMMKSKDSAKLKSPLRVNTVEASQTSPKLREEVNGSLSNVRSQSLEQTSW
jgi:hypothetical protein